MAEDTTARRKDSHLDLCATEEVEPQSNRTLLEDVRLVHCALPELSVDDVDLSVELFGKRLRAPLIITGMTGGTERAALVNRDLAALAEIFGLAFGVGSQRAMAEKPAAAVTFEVRSVAPNALVLGNIGFAQVAALGRDGLRRLRDGIGADAMALHLNAGQELTQPEGDRDFRGGYAAVGEMVAVFGDKLLVKETGCGVSPAVARRLVDLGVRAIDVSGLGGTSWVRVEQLRAKGPQAQVGEAFSAWGIPTAAAVATVRRAVGSNVKLIASGGIRTGLDVAKALALGADLGGMALPLFRAQQQGGRAAADIALQAILSGITQALLLTGSRNVTELRTQPRVVSGELKDWLAAL
ncbi:MAG: type 2 isopentenyl-diphosphate Delta-isomerase [Myxococcaceae bacterium]